MNNQNHLTRSYDIPKSTSKQKNRTKTESKFIFNDRFRSNSENSSRESNNPKIKTLPRNKTSNDLHVSCSSCEHCHNIHHIFRKDKRNLSKYILNNNNTFLKLFGNPRYNKNNPYLFVEDHKNHLAQDEIGLLPLPAKPKRIMKSSSENVDLYEIQRKIVMMRRYQYGKGEGNPDYYFPTDEKIKTIQKWWKKIYAITLIQKVFRGYRIRKRVGFILCFIDSVNTWQYLLDKLMIKKAWDKLKKCKKNKKNNDKNGKNGNINKFDRVIKDKNGKNGKDNNNKNKDKSFGNSSNNSRNNTNNANKNSLTNGIKNDSNKTNSSKNNTNKNDSRNMNNSKSNNSYINNSGSDNSHNKNGNDNIPVNKGNRNNKRDKLKDNLLKDFNKEKNSNSNNGTNKSNNSNKSNKSDLKQFMTKNKDRAINKNHAFITKIFYNKEDYLKMLKDIKDKNENGNENEDNNEHIYFKNTLGFNPCCYIDKIFLPSSAIDLRNKNNNDLNENDNNENNKEDEIDPINLNELFDKNKICFISKINVINNNTNKNDDLNNNSNNSKNNINDDDLNNQDPINLNDLTSKNYNYYIDKIRINSSCYEKDNKDNEKNDDDENMKYRNKNDEKTDGEPININDFFSKNLPCYLTKIRKINPNESNKNEIEEDNEVSPINLNNDLCDYKSKACYIDKIRKKLSYANKELSDISFNTNKTDENAAINLYHLTSKHKPCYIDKIRKIINKNGNENENEKENNKDKSFNDLDIGKNEDFIIDSVKKPLILTPDNNNCFMIKDNKVLDNNILPIKNENKLDNKDCYISKDRQRDSMNDLKKLQKIISNYLRNKNDKKYREKNNNNYRKPYINPLLITKDYINQEMNKQIKELFKTFQSKDDNNVENPNKNIFAIEKVPDVTLINNKEKGIPPEEENNNIQDLDNELITKFPLLFKNNICYLTKIRKELANGASYLSKYNEILQIPKINDNDIKDINYISKKRLKDNNKEIKKLQKLIKDFLSKLNKEKIYKKPLFNKFYYYEEIDTSDDEKPNKNPKNNNNITTKKNNNDDPNDEDESTKIKTKNYKNDDDYEEDEVVRIPKNIKTCKSKIHRYKHNHLLKVVVVKNDKIVDEKIIKKKRKGSDNYSKSDFESERSKKPDDLSENPSNKKKKTASVSPIAKNEIDDEDPKQKVKNKNNKKENPDKVKPLLDFDSNDIDFNKRKLIKKWKLGYGNYFYMSKIRLGDKKFLEDDKNKNKDNNEIYKNLPGINVKDSYMDKIRVGNEVYMEYLDRIINGKDKNKNNNENNNDNDDKNNNNNDNKRKLSNTEFLEDVYRKPINDKRKLSNTEFLEDIYKNKNNDNINDYLIGICYISKTRYKNPKSNINETKNELLSLLNMNYNLPMNALCFITKERFINDINKNNVNNLKNQNNLKNDKNDNEVENEQNNDPNKNEENNDDNNDEIILNPRSYLFKNNDNNDPNNESEINNNLNDYISKIYKRLILQVYPFKQQKNDVHYITKEIKLPLNKENPDTNNNANEKKQKNYSFIPLTKFFINKNIQEYVYPKLFPKTNKNASTINTLTSQNSVNNNKKNNDTNNGFPNYYNTIKRVYDFYKGKQRNKDPKSKAIFNKIIPDIDKSPSLNNLLTTLTNDPSKSNNIINIPYDPINSKNKNNNSPTEDDYINELGEFTKFDKNITDADFIKKNLKNNNILKKNNNLLSIIKYIDNEYNKLINGKYCTNCGLELPECKCNIFKDTEQEDDDDYIIDLDEDEDLNVGKKINFFEYDSNRSKGLLIPKKPKVVDYYNKPTSQIIIHDSKGLEKFNKNLLANCKKTDTYNSKNNKKNVKDNGPSARRAKGNEDNNLKSSCGSINSNSNASNGSKGSRVYNSGYNNKYSRKK